jgi:hypothetical protein
MLYLRGRLVYCAALRARVHHPDKVCRIFPKDKRFVDVSDVVAPTRAFSSIAHKTHVRPFLLGLIAKSHFRQCERLSFPNFVLCDCRNVSQI